jgi:hypothetical protein
MLGQDDRRELEAIEHHLEVSDPGFARALRAGRPRRPGGDRPWPLLLAMLLTGAAGAYQLKVRHSQRPSRRRGGRGAR